MVTEERISIKPTNRPQTESVDTLVVWFCESLDLSDKDNLEPAMLKEIINKSIKGNGVTSMELKKELGTPRTTVIYHLNRLIYSGIVVRKGRKYYLRSTDMASTLEELQADMQREFMRMIAFAQRMDAMFESDIYGRKRTRE